MSCASRHWFSVMREGGNPLHYPSFPRRRESTPSFVIPAKAGIHSIICHSREGGNPLHHLSFPRRRESTPSSVIPAKAGIHSIICHSREGGNPLHHLSFPRRRESTPSSRRTREWRHNLGIIMNLGNTIPAHAGMTAVFFSGIGVMGR